LTSSLRLTTQVRGQHYLDDKVKRPSASCAFALRRVLLIPSRDKLHHLLASRRHALPPRPAGAPLCFVVVFQVPNEREPPNQPIRPGVHVGFGVAPRDRRRHPSIPLTHPCQVPGTPRLHLVLLFERDAANDADVDGRDLHAFEVLLPPLASRLFWVHPTCPPLGAYTPPPLPNVQWQELLRRTTQPETVAQLKGRLKIVPNLAEGGGFVVRKTVGNKPAIIANALSQKQYSGDGYVEVDIDVEAAQHGQGGRLGEAMAGHRGLLRLRSKS